MTILILLLAFISTYAINFLLLLALKPVKPYSPFRVIAYFILSFALTYPVWSMAFDLVLRK